MVHVAQCLQIQLQFSVSEEDTRVTKRLCILTIVLLAALAAGCTNTNEAVNANANANTATASTRPGPDNSEITTSVDANGVKTETRVFHGNPRVSRVVVTTNKGTRTVKVYSPSGEEREVNHESQNVFEATGSAIADAAGFVASKSADVAGTVKDKTVAGGEKTADVAKTVGSKTAEGAKTVGEKTAEGAKTVGSKTAEGAKTVAEKTASGAKKTGRAIKKVFTP
jgi:hypothetical protein